MKEIAVIDVDDGEEHHELLVGLPKGLLDPAKSLGNVIADLQQLIAGVSSNDRLQQREATVRFRKLLSIGSEPPPPSIPTHFFPEPAPRAVA